MIASPSHHGYIITVFNAKWNKDLRSPFQPPDILLLIAAGLSLFACIVSGIYLARSYFGYTYRYVATPKVVRDHHTSVKAAYVISGKSEDEALELADLNVLSYIQERYAESAHDNTLNNDRKSFLLHRANGVMIAALAPAVVAASAFLFNSFHSIPVITRVELVNIKEALSKENSNGYRTPQGSASPTATPATPATALKASRSAAGPPHQGVAGTGKASSE